MAGARGAAARAGPAGAGAERMAGPGRCGAAGQSRSVADAVPGQGQPTQPLRRPRLTGDPADATALAAAATPRRAGTARAERAVRFAHRHRLHGKPAGTRGAPAGAVRPGGHAAHRGRSPGPQVAPAVAGAPAGTGDPGPGQLLGQYLPGREEGPEGALSETIM